MTEARSEADATASPTRFIQIDDEGYFKMDDLRVADAEAGRDWLSKVRMDDRGRAWLEMSGQPVLVEAFDEPYIALDIQKNGAGQWVATMPYGHEESFALESLSLDEWDRFHGRTERGVPFVFSRSSQARFFNMLDEFDDDSITVDGRRYPTSTWLKDNSDANNESFWTGIYRTEEPRWELGGPSHAFPALVPRLKLQKSRILVPGAGSGNDAAWFAEQGHIVTALDFSEEAVARAKQKYGHLTNLTFLQADVFQLPSSMNSSFDIVVEHTLYCAVTPSRRNELVKIWRRVLIDSGHLLGVFFTMDKLQGPPYGGSEWEIRMRLHKGFRSLYWTRLRDSRENRLGHELFIYAEKLPALAP